MTEFRTLTYEGLEVGEEFVSDTFLVTPEEVESYGVAVDDQHGGKTAVGTASGRIA